ncbi:MAG: hypothetical protein JRF33_25325 [Deltaproteobacteria bacterium]|nr:hypothetical protein [Deltaproteobacteria bacterium]
MKKLLGFFLVLFLLGGVCNPAWSWSENHHRWIVTDTVNYMQQSEDPILQWIGDWLRDAPGRNSLLRAPGEGWYEDTQCEHGKFSAACALRNEAANTDWYSDMSFQINDAEALAHCSVHLALTGLDPILASLLTWKQMLACAVIGNELEPTINLSVDIALDLSGTSLDESHPIGYHLTSFNHMMGVRFDNDKENRDYTGADLHCLDRDQEERLGYNFKYLGVSCDSTSEGDCADEGGSAWKFAFLNDLPFVEIDPGSCPDCAGSRYRNVTCHEHDGCQTGMTIPEARYFPLDNIAEYWMNQWKNDTASGKADVVKLGPVLHVTQDAFEPHHIYNYLGRGHEVFETWATTMLENRAFCRKTPLADCDENYLYDTLYSPITVTDYLNGYFLDLFNIEFTPEKILTDAAWRAARWDDEEHEVNADSATYLNATVWQAKKSDIGDNYIPVRSWYRTLAMGHNLSIAGTVTLLKKAFVEYSEHWAEKGYCSALHAQDEAAWYRSLPGPWAGASLPPVRPDQSHYVTILNAQDDEINTAETAHPYFNDSRTDSSNEVVFWLQHRPFLDRDTMTDSFELIFDNKSDWHAEAEGDRLVISIMYFNASEDRLENWIEWATYANKDELLAQPILFDNFPENKRLARVKVELVQGSGKIFVGGNNGLIARYDGQVLVELDSGTTKSITGIWGSNDDNIFATTHSMSTGSILHYDGNAADDWTNLGQTINLWGFRGIWGLNENDIYAVGDALVAFIWNYDGFDWSEIYRLGLPSDFWSIVDIWGTSSENLFAVGGRGAVHHFDGQDWTVELVTGQDQDILLGVWGASAQDVFAVGANGNMWHYDGTTWSPMVSGTTEDINDVWGTSGQVFAVGDQGLLLGLQGGDWVAMDSGTTVDLFAVWGNHAADVYAVGRSGTMIHFDGIEWQHIETGTSSDLYTIWGATKSCNPEPKFGFRIKSVLVNYHQTGRTPPNSDSAQIAAEVAIWIKNILNGEHFGSLGIIWDCAPSSACDEDLQGILQDLFQPFFDQRIALESEQIFDLVHQGLVTAMPDKSIHPALVAYAVVDAAHRASPGSLADSILTSQAIGWSLDRQGFRSKKPAKDTLQLTAHLDFNQQRYGKRPGVFSADGSSLPGVAAPDTDGYPGFREPTEEEISSMDGLTSYMRAREESVAEYAWRNRIEKVLGNIEARKAILATYDGSDPETTAKVEEMLTRFDHAQTGLQLLNDDDDDGVSGLFDACPDICARGLDSDRNGCLDDVCELGMMLIPLDAWWMPKMVLSMRARMACAKARAGKAKAAAGQLKAFVNQVRAYARIGWIDKQAAVNLTAYANNARKVVLGQLDDLMCD